MMTSGTPTSISAATSTISIYYDILLHLYLNIKHLITELQLYLVVQLLRWYIEGSRIITQYSFCLQELANEKHFFKAP